MTIDWREAFIKYVGMVGEYEGTSFLYERDWTTIEWEAIEELWNEDRD